MAGRKTLVVLLGAVALLAVAQTFGLIPQSAQACLSIGNASYRVATNMLGADLTVRIDSTHGSTAVNAKPYSATVRRRATGGVPPT